MLQRQAQSLTGKLQAMVSVFKEPDFNEEQVTAYGEFQDKLTEIDQKAQDERLQQEQSYQDQLTDTQARRELRDQREAEDLALADRRRRKSLGEDLKSVDTQANANIISAQQEANERRSEINDQYEREDLERIRNYNLEREKEERQHRVTLLEAAASLNAIAVWRENNRYRLKKQEGATELREEEQRAKERRARELQSLDETLEARIEREKTFAEKQKAEIQRRFDEQLALEAENRALMLKRRQEDEQLEDERLAAANQARLDQIETQTAKERQVAEQAFIQTFNKLAQSAGMHQNTMINIQRKGQQRLRYLYPESGVGS